MRSGRVGMETRLRRALVPLVVGISAVAAGLLFAFGRADVAVTVGVGLAVLGSIVALAAARSLGGPVDDLADDAMAIAEGAAPRRGLPRHGPLAGIGEALRRLASAAHEGERLVVASAIAGEDLARGAEIQASLLPERLPLMPGVDVAAYYQPHGEVGGDYYDFLELGHARLGFVMFDVSGHGIGSSIVMAAARSLLREAAWQGGGPAETLRRVNIGLRRDVAGGIFVTGVYAELDAAARRLRVANAGHHPVLVWRSSTHAIDEHGPTAPALALAEPIAFNKALKEVEVPLDLGDRVVFFTDGVVELANVQGEQIGDEHFRRLVARDASHSSNAFVNRLVGALDAHRGTAAAEDDVTLVSFTTTV